MSKDPGTTRKLICQNKKARFRFDIVESMEAGLVLTGTEVKSLRLGRANLSDAYAKIRKGEVWLYNANISPYPFAYHDNHDPLRPRKLLFHKSEIKRLIGKIEEKGFTLIPLKLYFSQSHVKAEMALAKGRNVVDRRHELKKRDANRELDRQKKNYKIKT
ncbi:MAG: SsrA-binding protein SmpB [Deltaproteobacteria bacterium]|nr:SsrA-binding protein SmpB [Deltaproteobacteria bacterium]